MQTTITDFQNKNGVDPLNIDELDTQPLTGEDIPKNTPCLQAPSVQFNDIYIFGCLHESRSTLARLTLAVNHITPDLIAVEAHPEAIRRHHPDNHRLREPLRNEVDLALWFAWMRESPAITGIKENSEAPSNEESQKLLEIDTEIFRDQGWIDSEEDLTIDKYRSLTLQEIQKWCAEFQTREPEMYERIVANRDTAMAGRLRAIRETTDVEQIVVFLGLQHLPGVVAHLQTPTMIPDEDCEVPPIWSLNFPTS